MKINGIAFIAGCALLTAIPAPAVWFDCDKAKTKMEKALCKDPLLSRLDDTLSAAYYVMKDSAADPIALRNQQREWLAGLRKAYQPGFDLASAYRARTAVIRKMPIYAWKHYTSKLLGIEFDYPSNRAIQVDTENVTLKIISVLAKDGEYDVEIGIRDGDFDHLADSVGFEKRKDGWYYPNARCGDEMAKPISGTGWKGYSAETSFGVSDPEKGYHACAGSMVSALLGNGRVWILFNMAGGDNADRFSRSLQSLRILP
jgi:uncharacterized protein